MPLYEHAIELIRLNLEAIQSGRRAKAVVIGVLTDRQRDAINAHRIGQNASLQPIVNEVVFLGSHIYKRRIVDDGYTVDDVIAQIVSAMASDAEFKGSDRMQMIVSIHPRGDRLGNTAVRDQAVFECTARRPNAELYSVIPKGDRIKPAK